MFNTAGSDFEVRFENLQGQNGESLLVDELMIRITLSMQEMLNRLLDGINGHDFVRIVIQNRYLYEAIKLPFIRRDQLNVDVILAAIMNVLNSNKDFLIDGNLKINLIHVAMPRGGRSKKAFDSRLKKSKSIVRVRNHDNMCLARAIVISKAKADKDAKYASIRDSNPMQKRLARALCQAAGVDHTKQCGYDEFAIFQHICQITKLLFFQEKKNGELFTWESTKRNISIYFMMNMNNIITP